MAGKRRAAALVILLCYSVTDGRSQEEEPAATNLQRLESAFSSTESAILDSANVEPGVFVAVKVEGGHLPWLLQATVLKAIEERGILLTVSPDSADVVFSFVGREAHIEYPERISGIFTPSKLTRRASVTVSAVVTDRRADRYRYHGNASVSLIDTVAASDVPSLESTAIPETHGAPPPQGWWSRALGPLVITGALILSVVLFFSVRSS